jgi:hypothetical protein
MKTEEKIVLAGAGIAALVILGLWMNRGKAAAPPTAGPSTPPATSPVVSPPSTQAPTQSCLWQ